MKVVARTQYLDRLLMLADVPDIKVITGIRRSGKSTLLRSLGRRLTAERGDRVNLIQIDLSLRKNAELATAEALYNYVSERFQKGRQNFVFIDEVQLCADFEHAVTWLHAEMKYSLYITGSNAFLLSSDLATLFTGRTVEIEVFPFSFAEYLAYWRRSDLPKAFRGYLAEGGMAGSYLQPTPEAKHAYLNGVFNTLIVRDIFERFEVKNQALLERIADFLTDNIGNYTSLRNIANSLAGPATAGTNTIGNYIKYLTEAFAFYRVRRYDIKGKKYLSTQDKYYLADHALRPARLGTRFEDTGRVCENIVAIELLRRGYEIYVGFWRDREVDFVAKKRGQQLYIQVADSLADPQTLEREMDALLSIKDAYPKLILANVGLEQGDLDGVRVVDLAHWLAGEAEL